MERKREREKKTRLGKDIFVVENAPGKGLDCWEFKRFLMRGILILLLTRNKTNHRFIVSIGSSTSGPPKLYIKWFIFIYCIINSIKLLTDSKFISPTYIQNLTKSPKYNNNIQTLL